MSLDNALPQQEYFYSQIQYNLPNNAYNVYKLQRSHYSERFYYIEIAECYGRINYAIKYDRYFSKEKQYVNETNIDIRYDNEEYGKRMIVVHTPDYVDAIYIIVFPREENFSFPDEDTIHFALKYWSFSYSEKADGSVLNVISKDSKLKGIVSKDIKYEKIDNDEYKFTWSPLELTDSTKVEYYIRVYSRNKFKNENESRIRYLERMIKTAVIISDESKDDEVGMFNTVDVYFEEDDEIETYKIVTTVRGNSLKNLISKESPLGAAIFGHKVGDRCEVKVNDDYSYFVVIKRIENTTDDGSDVLKKF